ncbi:MAG: hypothetical protein ACLFP1_03095 [Candidatus Goldiibacteriota bacterium]
MKKFLFMFFAGVIAFGAIGCGKTTPSDPEIPVYAPGHNWTRAVQNAEFSPRWGHAGVSYGGEIYIIGGFDGVERNDVYSSANGQTFVQETASAAFSARNSHRVVVFDTGAGEKMVLTGGGYKNEVWESSNGADWGALTLNAEFSGRSGHTSVVFDSKIWVIGGQNPLFQKDVWSSSNGSLWTEETGDAGFGMRTRHASVVFDGKIWIIGGIGAGNETMGDVWYSSDGISWTRAVENAEFGPRSNHDVFVYDEKMWLFGGLDGDGNYVSDRLFYSSDGLTWTQVSVLPTALYPRRNHINVIFDGVPYIIGGMGETENYNDSWYSN